MKEIHHANVITGGDRRSFVFEILKNDLEFDFKGNPDFLLMETESVGIDDARYLVRWAAGKPLLGATKAALIIAKSLTFEAQNALLKVLEEPPLGTYIFINIENLGGLLPTFMSRVRVLDSAETDVRNSDAHKFLKSKIKEKFSIINSLYKKEDKVLMKDMIKNLEEVAYEDKASADNLKNILTAKIFASARGSSPKMLLEWLSCVL